MVLAGKRWFFMFFLVFWPSSQLQVKEETGEVPGNGEALEGMVELSLEAQDIFS